MTTTLVFTAKRLIGSLKHVISMGSSLMYGLGYISVDIALVAISAAALKRAVLSFKSGGKIPTNKLDEIDDYLKYLDDHNGTPPPGVKGGSVYQNNPSKFGTGGQKLPDGVSYTEYRLTDVAGSTERIVIGSDDSVWYTADHYQTFTQIK